MEIAFISESVWCDLEHTLKSSLWQQGRKITEIEVEEEEEVDAAASSLHSQPELLY